MRQNPTLSLRISPHYLLRSKGSVTASTRSSKAVDLRKLRISDLKFQILNQTIPVSTNSTLQRRSPTASLAIIKKKRPASLNLRGLVIIARCAIPAVFDCYFVAGATGAVAGASLRSEFGSPTFGAVFAPSSALKKGSSLNPNSPAVNTAGNEFRVVL